MKIPCLQKFVLPAILVVGLAIRLLAFSHVLAPGVSAPTMDEMNYRELACGILDNHRYATWSEGFLTQSTRAPVYPLMIAAAYVVSGSRGYAVPKTLNLVLDMLAILAVYVLAKRLYGAKTALFTAGTYAVFGHAVNYMLISSPHTLAVLLTLLTSIALVELNRNYKSSVLLFAFFQTLLIHTRPVFLVVLPVLIPVIYLQLTRFNPVEPNDGKERAYETEQMRLPPLKQLIERLLAALKADFRVKCLKTSLPLLLTLLLCLPWGIRNYRIHKTIVPICTIAGWHIASNGSFDVKLSLKFLTDHIYAPEHRGFKEGDYFVLGRKMFFNAFSEHPVKLPLFGIARLAAGWSPPSPWWRFATPKAYVFPIRVGKAMILPLPDFEGMLYLFIFANLAVFGFVKRLRTKAAKAFWDTLREFRGISLWMAGYAAAHVVGVPLIAYRFIIEPLFIVFAMALLINYWRVIREIRESTGKTRSLDDNGNGRNETAILAVYALAFNVFILFPAFSPINTKIVDYTSLPDKSNYLSYSQIRDLQWKHLGNIHKDAKISVAGMVLYGTPGFKFVPDEYNPVNAPSSASARLRVEYDSRKRRLGIGDLRLNFRKSELPRDGAFVKLSGTVETGPFKELILNVEKVVPITQPAK